MRNTILAGIGGALIGAISAGAVIAEAQPAPPQPPSPGMEAPMHRPMMDGWMMRHHGMRGGGPMDFRAFALVYRQADRQLTPPDVQKIAEAFLLWNGNHAWKVADVSQVSDNAIGFTLTTQEGSVIAKFTMDPHTAKVTRTG